MHTGLWKMGSRLAAGRRPGMTGLPAFNQIIVATTFTGISC